MDKLKLIGMLLAVLVVLSIPVGCKVYQFSDCKKVGHSTLYCIIKAGK